MLRTISNIVLCAATLLCFGIYLISPAFAQATGEEGNFTIINQTKSNIVVGFYTNDGSGWSDNWLDELLEPGAEVDAAFTEDEGSCDQLFQVGWLGQDGNEVLDDPIQIDICEASNVYLADNQIYFD